MKKVIFSLISFVIVIILVFIVIIPFWDALGVARAKIINKEIELENVKQLVTKIEQLKDSYNETESEAQKMFLALPKEKDIPNLLIQFQALANNSGLLLESISFGELEQQKGKQNSFYSGDNLGEAILNQSDIVEKSQEITSSLRSLGVDLSIVGSYEEFKDYLSSLSDNIRSMDVKTISFNAPSSQKTGENTVTNEEENYSFSLSVVVYYQ